MKTATKMQIENLKMKAGASGDTHLYNTCVRALNGSVSDLKVVSDLIAAAQSSGSSGPGYGSGG